MLRQENGDGQPRRSIGHRQMSAICFDDVGNDGQTQAAAASLAIKLNAARQCRFRPGTRLGEPVPVVVTIELDFTLR